MSNKMLCLPQLNKLEVMYQEEAEQNGIGDRDWAIYVDARLEAIKEFKLMLEGIDVTTNIAE